ncbi:S41 family peptidase [Lutibacter sp.]|uniref:S41 family peptidase n=1 Tax=Lutibacter sp. TaxID=1925666 RepID=UPI001A1F5737|nr:S41 family peptidase [Lutibacter sp.]MBI9042309.1 peptidase S41 [Lutibacter sp.]
MKRVSYKLALSLLSITLFIGCNKSDDSPTNPTVIDFSQVEIQDFIWEGMNTYYLWKDNVPTLANTKDDNNESYFNYLNSYPNPDDFFESLIYNRQNIDKWSWVVDDYVALENSFQGISTSNGVKFRLSYESGSDYNILGYVRYIQPNSDASTKDVKRGYVFDAIDGIQLTVDNYSSLLEQDTYIMNFADLNGGVPISNGKSVTLTKSAYQENPVLIAKTLDISGKKIGYIMYNAFTSTYDQQLNEAFGQLKSEGATELVLDLRYNGGGSVQTSVYLASMITGQFNGQLFAKEKWNTELQSWFETNHPDWVVNNFVNQISKTDTSGNTVQLPINSLNLTRVFVITTGSSASASELIINGLKPYIDVVTIGTTTSGKYTGSITLYDSDTFGRTGANLNPRHTWAIQPIVLETVNKLGDNDKDGFDPTIELIEYVSDFQELGLETEPLLAKAIEQIAPSAKTSVKKKPSIYIEEFKGYSGDSKYDTGMHIDKELPKDLFIRKN